MPNRRALSVAALLGMFLVGAGGCARWEISFRRQHWEEELRGLADVAFAQRFHAGSVAADYAEGWREGYYRVLRGGDGQPPLVPPEGYWSPRSRHVGGPPAVAEWQRGYVDGAAVALDEGRRGYATVAAAEPQQPAGRSEAIHPATFTAELAPQGLPARPLEPREATAMPKPLPPTEQRLDGMPDEQRDGNGEDPLRSESSPRQRTERRAGAERDVTVPERAGDGALPAPEASPAAGAGETDPLWEAQLDAAFERLQAARAVMPRRRVLVDRQETVPPPPRIASPFGQTYDREGQAFR